MIDNFSKTTSKLFGEIDWIHLKKPFSEMYYKLLCHNIYFSKRFPFHSHFE